MDVCMLCKSYKKDDIQYGEFLKKKNFGVHTFCLYLSSNLSQNGSDSQGFLGFLPKDIRNEIKRISSLKCCYCYKRYANIGCCVKKCRRTFHFICGLENKAENRFCKDFRSFCHSHARKVEERPSSTETCLICFDSLCAPGEKFNGIDMILTPCCRNGWFHKLCLQRFAKTSGYFFKCPLCNDDKIFREKLPAQGIFIPNQDAAWELEPNAFAELLERPNKCVAERCKNKKGRKANSDSNPFVMCNTCGSIAIHKHCLSNDVGHFICTDCSLALEERDSGRASLNSQVNQNDDEYIDVCHVSDKEDLEIINRLIATSSEMAANKRDSGTNNDMDDISDDETLHTLKKYQQTKTNEAENSSFDTDIDDIRPCSSKRTLRIRLRSESSESAHEIKRSCTRKNRFISETESSCGGETINRYDLNNRQVCDERDKVKTSESKLHRPAKRRNSPNVFIDSDIDDTEQKSLNASQLNGKAQDSENSDGEEVRRWYRKRKENCILSDSDDEIPAQKQKFAISENIETKPHPVKNIAVDSDEDIDSDPLENFIELLNKRNTNWNYKETRNLSTNRLEEENEKFDTGNKNRKYVGTEDKDSSSKKQNNLDISCVALRTRRKTICVNGNNNKTTQTKLNKNQNSLNTSCIALRTRRKTICGRSDFSKQSEAGGSPIYQFEMSQVYEKLHESSGSIDILSTDDGATESDLDNFIVDDGYKDTANKFEISCVANRTRRRKFLKCQPLSKIDEHSDCNSTDSSISSELICRGSRFRKSNKQRINSTSSEEYAFKTKSEKYPLQNKGTESSNAKHVFSYYPFNSHHPHNSNRNRI